MDDIEHTSFKENVKSIHQIIENEMQDNVHKVNIQKKKDPKKKNSRLQIHLSSMQDTK